MGNVEYVDISRYSQQPGIQELKRYFVNHSPNPGHFEWWCFQRIFVLKYFCEERKLNRVFHMDSDNIMLYDVNTYPYQEENAYQIMHNYETWRIGNSVHAGVVSLNMCNAFMKLYKEVYINKLHNYYVSGKIEQYRQGKRGDGVSDMTFYYILQKEGRIKAQDLSIPMIIGGKKYVFLNNVNTGEGYASSDQYEMAGDIIKIIKNREGEYMIYDKIHKEYHIIYNIHFQGIGKRYLELGGEPWVQNKSIRNPVVENHFFTTYEKMRKLFTHFNIEYVASGGTFIGAVRDGAFIAWDYDMDFCVDYKYKDVMWSESFRQFSKKLQLDVRHYVAPDTPWNGAPYGDSVISGLKISDAGHWDIGQIDIFFMSNAIDDNIYYIGDNGRPNRWAEQTFLKDKLRPLVWLPMRFFGCNPVKTIYVPCTREYKSELARQWGDYMTPPKQFYNAYMNDKIVYSY